jgi:hypothetical protein
MREKLDRTYIAKEVETTLFQMGPGKAPGVDGFTAGFFQKHWALLHAPVTEAVLLNGGDMPEVLNQTILVLIPKIANPDVLANLDQSHFAM